MTKTHFPGKKDKESPAYGHRKPWERSRQTLVFLVPLGPKSPEKLRQKDAMSLWPKKQYNFNPLLFQTLSILGNQCLLSVPPRPEVVICWQRSMYLSAIFTDTALCFKFRFVIFYPKLLRSPEDSRLLVYSPHKK